MPYRYQQRGVSADKEDVHQAIRNLDKGLFPKAFCKIVPDYISKDENYAVAMHADGAGTKAALAYIYWKETDDISVWRDIAHDAVIMNIDDILCVGVTGDVVLSSTIGRNKYLITGDVIAEIIQGVEDTLCMLRSHGFNIISAGGETADVGDLVRTVIVDSTVVARIKRSEVIPNDRIQAGDVIVGLSSFGQATYEKVYNGGIGSNGLTSLRHDIFAKIYAQRYMESYDQNMSESLTYAGDYEITDRVSELPLDVGRLALSPTRTYAPIICTLLETLRPNIHGMVHCTGGGQTKVLHFLEQLCVVKDNLFDTPPLFKLAQKMSKTSWQEMYKIFNMGHRMEIYIEEKYAAQIIDVSKQLGVEAKIVGHVEKSRQKEVIIDGPHGRFHYS